MNTKLLAYGPLCALYQGALELLEGSLLQRFIAPRGEPSFTVTLRRGVFPPEDENLPIIHATPSAKLYGYGDGWQRRFSAAYDGQWKEYAVLHYTDDAAELLVAPVCRNIPACVEGCTAFEHLSLCAGALSLHASHINHRGGSIVFTAPSGTGKSTQAALWEHYRGAKIINGDKTLLVRTSQGFVASGIPYAGTSGICKNESAPLRAIVVLEQGRENTLIRLQGSAAAARLMSGVIHYPWHEEDTHRVLALVAQLVAQVPIYLQCCLPEESAVACLEKALYG